MKIKASVLLATVLGQNCISLKGSKHCGGMDQYSVLPANDFNNLETLDAYLLKTMFNNAEFQAKFKPAFECPNFTGKEGRYGMSTFCGLLVSASQEKCNPSVPPLTLCSSTCSAHMMSLQTVFNSEQCAPNAAVQARQQILSPSSNPPNIAQFCSSLQTNPKSVEKGCFIAVTSELRSCGFLSEEEKKQYCAKSAQDPCCSMSEMTTGEAEKILNPANNTFLIAGIVAAAVIFIGVVFFVFQRISKRRQRPTSAYKPPPTRASMQSKTMSFFRKGGAEMGNPPDMDERGRSSLFTTIRASQIFQNGPAPPVPGGIAAENNAPYSEMGDAPYQEDGAAFKVQIFEDYDAGLDDEMSCSVGDIIIVKEEYDDSWASGFNITSGEEGIFPMAISEPLNQSMRPPSSRVGRPRSGLSARSQSLLPPQRY